MRPDPQRAPIGPVLSSSTKSILKELIALAVNQYVKQGVVPKDRKRELINEIMEFICARQFEIDSIEYKEAEAEKKIMDRLITPDFYTDLGEYLMENRKKNNN